MVYNDSDNQTHPYTQRDIPKHYIPQWCLTGYNVYTHIHRVCVLVNIPRLNILPFYYNSHKAPYPSRALCIYQVYPSVCPTFVSFASVCPLFWQRAGPNYATWRLIFKIFLSRKHTRRTHVVNNIHLIIQRDESFNSCVAKHLQEEVSSSENSTCSPLYLPRGSSSFTGCCGLRIVHNI